MSEFRKARWLSVFDGGEIGSTAQGRNKDALRFDTPLSFKKNKCQ